MVEYNMCSICMELLKPGDITHDLPCRHEFHMECLRSWLRQKNECPTCRGTVYVAPGSASSSSATRPASSSTASAAASSPTPASSASTSTTVTNPPAVATAAAAHDPEAGRAAPEV